MKKLLKIDSDCLCVVDRIRAIDDKYRIFLNLENMKFELFYQEDLSLDFCLTFPFETLDCRCIDLTLKTRVQNSDALFEEMERENELNTRRQFKSVFNDFKEKIYDS